MGFGAARLIPATGHMEVAAVLKTLLRAASLPLRLREEGDVYRLGYPIAESELRQWRT